MPEGTDAVAEHIVDHPLITEMQDSYLTYSMSVITSRALPDVRDGLKPSQRRILVAMNDLNLGPRAQTKKCSKISGDTSGNYHPHGDSVIYPTLVRMAQPWNMRERLVDGQGNFGSVDGDPPAAMRYTEARMTLAATTLLEDLEYDTVDFIPNYDNSRTEPTVLPGKFPNLLVNGATGIAVGMATNLVPHNVGEVCDALMAQLDNPDISLVDLLSVLPGPDFPTAGQICGRRGIIDAFSTGRGRVVVRGRIHVEEGRTGRSILVITELPYTVMRCAVVEKLAAAVKSGVIKGISAINDASDRKNPVRIEVDLKRDANEDVIINQIFEYTPLQSACHIMNIALVGRRPRTLTLKQMLELYLEHRRNVIRRRSAFMLRRAKQKAHLLEGLILAVGDIEDVIRIIRESSDPPSAKAALMARPLRLADNPALRRLLSASFVQRFGATDHHLTAVQAGAILSMQLQRLTGLEIEKLAGDHTKLVEEILVLEAILADEQRVSNIIREDLLDIKQKFPGKRRTEIVEAVGDFSLEALIADEQVVVTISRGGYIKRTDIDSYRKQGRGGRGIRGGSAKEGDFLEHLFVVSTHDTLLFFTNRGRVYWSPVHAVPVMGRTSRGRSIANLLKMREDETHRAVLPVKEYEESFVVFATACGVVKKTPMQAFSHPRSSGIIAISLDDGDTLINVERTTGSNEVVLGSAKGMAIRFAEGDVRAMGRTARGVRGMTLAQGDSVVAMVAIDPGGSVLTVCENGYGKRTCIDEYRKTKRGAKGVINIRTTDRNGEVVAIKAVDDDDELMLITAKGIMLRTDLTAVREIGRATQGVRLIRLEEGDKVVAVAKLVPENAGAESTESADASQDAAAGQGDAPGGDTGNGPADDGPSGNGAAPGSTASGS